MAMLLIVRMQISTHVGDLFWVISSVPNKEMTEVIIWTEISNLYFDTLHLTENTSSTEIEQKGGTVANI